MKWACGVLIMALGFLGCGTTANPRSCLDGSCTDPQFPYCDLEGLIDVPMSCVAVECSAGEFKACRGDRAITCNTTGNNFDLVECPNGCDLTGCITPPVEPDCTTNAECTNPAPICSMDMTCRGCQSDDECTSTVCDVDSGACVAETAIIYASPTGVASGDCGLLTPCTLTRATMLAATAGLTKTLRLLPGTYGESMVMNATSIRAVATGATIGDNNSNVVVHAGGTLTLRGGTIDPSGSEAALRAGDPGTVVAPANVSLRNVKLVAANTASIFNGSVRIVASQNNGGLSPLQGATLELDRVLLTDTIVSPGTTSVAIRVTNSVFHNSYVTSAPDMRIALSTFVFTKSSGVQACDNLASAQGVYFENNVLFATPATNLPFVAQAGMCQWKNNIMFPQSNVIAGNVIADPQLQDVSTSDFRLKATSPAINAAVPSAGLGSDHDFDGVARPQGTSLDIGAFEFVAP